jgi:hypothetical protein
VDPSPSHLTHQARHRRHEESVDEERSESESDAASHRAGRSMHREERYRKRGRELAGSSAERDPVKRRREEKKTGYENRQLEPGRG